MADLDRVLMISHEDFDPYASTWVGFDEDKNFNIYLEYEFSEEPSLNYKKIACIDKDTAYLLSKKNKISLLQLPEFFAKKFEYDGYFCYASDVVDLFSEVLDYLVDSGISYRLK